MPNDMGVYEYVLLLVYLLTTHSNDPLQLNFKCNFGNAIKQTTKQISKLH